MVKKRKTKEQKIRAGLRRETAVVSGESAQSTALAFQFVNRQSGRAQLGTTKKGKDFERIENTSQFEFLASHPQDLIKTLILASAILLSEFVLYFFWKF